MSYCTLRWAYEQKLASPTLKAILVALAYHADKSGECWPTQQCLADETELSERAIRGGLAELQELGLISRNPKWERGHRVPDLITLNRNVVPVGYRQDVPVETGHTGTTFRANRQLVPSKPATGAGISKEEQPYEQPYELKISPLSPPAPAPEPAEPEPPPKAKPPPRASRIPDDLTLSDEWLQFALSKGLSHDDASGTFDEFLDYWRGVPGSRGLKLDWFATWRNRVRTIAQRLGENRGYVPRRNGRSDDSLLGAYQRAAARFSN